MRQILSLVTFKADLSVRAQCLATWFSCQEISWIFDISCQDHGNNSWQDSQDFARLWKEIQEKFWTSWRENQNYPQS